MATNFFFNNFGSSMEQSLIEDLVIESIKIYGHDLYYLPRSITRYDQIYGEDAQASTFDSAFPIEMYIKNVDGFGGDGDFLSKFNLQIRDQITFTVARRIFAEEVGAELALPRPREGDVIYFPLTHKLYQIKFVEHEGVFYQMGSLQAFDLTCELMEYTNEFFNTGVDEIDAFTEEYSTDIDIDVLLQQDGSELLLEDGGQLVQETFNIEAIDDSADNEVIQAEALDFLDFSEINPFSETKF